jgi:hypothetical protein
VLEKFVRVAYPDHFAPGDLLGRFVNLCQQSIGKPDQILDAARTREWTISWATRTRFYNETNETEAVNDGALRAALTSHNLGDQNAASHKPSCKSLRKMVAKCLIA